MVEKFGGDDMLVRDFDDALRVLLDALPGDKAPSVKALRQKLRGLHDLRIADAAEQLRAGRQARAVRARTPSPLRVDVLRRHVERLKASLNDSEKYEEAFGELVADDTARQQEVLEIARQLFGYKVKSGLKRDLLKSIGEFQTQHAIRTHTQAIAHAARPI